MKIVDLNNYEENDGLKDKLRQRMDAHEPELSDSVWDRINHQMDRREANRKRRFLWWFSSVAVVLLTSGVITYLAFSTKEPAKTIAQNTNEIIITSPNNPNVKLGTVNPTDNGEPLVENNTPTSTETENASVVRNNTVQLPPPPAPFDEPSANNQQPTTLDNSKENDKPSKGVEKLETKNPDAAEKLSEGSKKEEKSETKEIANNDDETANKEETKKKEKLNPKKDKGIEAINFCGINKRWFIGINYSYNLTHRSTNDIGEKQFFYPEAETRDKYEKRAFTSSYGVEIGFHPLKNFFIKSGVNIFNTKEIVSYDIKEREDIDVITNGAPIPPDNAEDSLASGSTFQKQNTYNYIQIPLEVGYTYCLGNRWSVLLSGGVSYNILQDYNYHLYDRLYGIKFYEPESNNNFDDMFGNYFMVSAGVGTQYSISKSWVATLGLNYRRALTSAGNDEYGVDVKPYTVGATTGLAFRF